MAIMDPLFDEHGTIICCDGVIFATQVPTPEMLLSCFPNYAVIITKEEAVPGLSMDGIASAEIFGVRCAPVRLGPRYPHRQVLLLSFPELCPSDEMHDPDDLVLLMWEEFPSHRQ